MKHLLCFQCLYGESMIAYNHYIKFIPVIDNIKDTKGSFVDIITVKKSCNEKRSKDIKYALAFSNNQGRECYLQTDREFSSTKLDQPWEYKINEVVTFFWYSNSLKIEYIPHKKFSFDLLKYWTLHIILPMYFTIEEKYNFLHAGAVEVENKSILFVAESFGGKSTITDFFLKQGHTLISDDKVATYRAKDEFLLIPSHPHHRPYRKVEDLGFFINNFSTSAKPIHAIYELKKSKKNVKINIDELQGIDKFISLRHASEMNLFFHKVKRFEYLMEMAKVVPVFIVSVPWDLNRLNEVYKIIVQHSKNIKERYSK